MNKLIMLIGVASSGKSTLATKLKEIKEVDEIVSSDVIRAELFGNENDQKHNNEVFNEVHKRIRSFLKEGKNVCYDATNLSSKRRRNFLNTLNGLSILKECIVVMTSFDDCIKFQSHRERKVPEDVIRNQIKSFQCPFYFEGWDNISIIHNSHIPLIWLIEQNNIPHDNPHHTLSIKEHMNNAARVYKNTTSWEDYSILVYEALQYHDLGKYFCKTFMNKRGEKSEIAHYYEHQNVSAYFYLLDIHNCSKNGLIDTLYIANLIQYHMEFFLRNEKGISRLEELVGKRMINDLTTIHYFDRLAH